MDLQRIHDVLIDRARGRTYNSKVHHYHHIIPKHEDRHSSEVVPLTVKEHYVVHHIRYLLTGTWQNKVAWLLLKGVLRLSSSMHTIQSEAGKIGGKKTKETKVGIFSDLYDRGKQTKKNWETGAMSHVDFSKTGHIGGNKTKESGVGIFDPKLKHMRSEWAKIGAEALKKSGNIGGVCNKEWIATNSEFIKEVHEKNSELYKKQGTALGSMFWWNDGTKNKKSFACPGEGWVRGMLMSDKKRAQVYSMLAGHNKKETV